MRPWPLLALVGLAGCHARFRRHVDDIDAVRPQVLVTSGPYAVLGGASSSDLVGAAVGVVQGVRGLDAADRIAGAVDLERVNDAFTKGLVDTLGDGPPFPVGVGGGAALLQVQVVGYGLDAPVMGQPGMLTYNVDVSILLPSGKKVYANAEQCSVPFGDPKGVAVATGTVDNVKQLERMSDAEIQASFEAAAALCGQTVVTELRRHAG